jgi:hypothetical protein
MRCIAMLLVALGIYMLVDGFTLLKNAL